MPPRGDEEDKINRLRGAIYSRKYSDKIGERERRDLGEEKMTVPEDWQHDIRTQEPETPLDQILKPPKPSAVQGMLSWLIWIGVVFFLGAVAFFLYYLFFGGGASVSSRNIDITISGPPQIGGGELANIEITIANHNRDALELSELAVTYPPGTLLNASSCTYQTCRVTLGTIAAGGSTVVKLPAIYEGGAGEHGTVHAELEYRLGGSTSIFTDTSDYTFVFTSSPVSLSIDGNTETVSGQPMQMTVNVSSNSNTPVSGVVLSGSFPFGFKMTSASPAQDSSGLWQLGTLMPGDKKAIQINGVLSGEVSDARVFHFTVGTRTSATSTSIEAPLADTSLTMKVARPFLDLGISVNEAPGGKPITVSPGDIVNVSVKYTNNLTAAIQNAAIVARLSGIKVDGSSIHSEDGFFRSTDNAVLWDKTTTGGTLSNVGAGESGTLGFTFQMPSSEDLSGMQNPVLDISVSAAGQRQSESGVPENLQSTLDQKIAVATAVTLAGNGLYFTDPFGASGPMPPKAESETTYAIAFTVTNTTNAIQAAKLTAQLPPYVRLVGNHYLPASEKVSFDTNTGLFTWDVGDIAAGAGLNGTAPRQVVVEVGLTPSTSQIGTEPALIKSIKLTGTDAATSLPITKTAPDITTNIVGDPGFSSVNAKVVK